MQAVLGDGVPEALLALRTRYWTVFLCSRRQLVGRGASAAVTSAALSAADGLDLSIDG